MLDPRNIKNFSPEGQPVTLLVRKRLRDKVKFLAQVVDLSLYAFTDAALGDYILRYEAALGPKGSWLRGSPSDSKASEEKPTRLLRDAEQTSMRVSRERRHQLGVIAAVEKKSLLTMTDIALSDFVERFVTVIGPQTIQDYLSRD
jgi:hypothetical protein